MCTLCSDRVKQLTVKEKLNAFNEVVTTENITKEHITDMYEKLLEEYADEISKEVMEKTK